jgi:transposase
LRKGKRQAAPFSKGPPKPEPKSPGRKAAACEPCCGTLIEDDVVEQFQTDIPRKPIFRKFRIHRGHCAGCGSKAQGRHPLQTSDAIGAAASQIGPEA